MEKFRISGCLLKLQNNVSKILSVLPKSDTIMVLSQYWTFFIMLPVKLSLLIFYASVLVSVLCFFLPLSDTKIFPLLFVIAFRSDRAAITSAITRVGRAIEKRSHEPIYKNDTKNEAKRLRGTTFPLTKIEWR